MGDQEWKFKRVWEKQYGSVVVSKRSGEDRFDVEVARDGRRYLSSATTLRRAQLLADRFWSQLGAPTTPPSRRSKLAWEPS